MIPITKEQKEYMADEMYLEGYRCLELELPWQTAESTEHEAEVLTEEDVYLEAGTGGSTLFAARRCKFVTAIETSPQWASKVKEVMDREKIFNASYNIIPLEKDIVEYIHHMDTSNVTVFSVDTQGGWCRSKILNSFLDKGISPALKMIILDNYAHEGLFPLHFNKKVIDSPEWGVFDYNHPRWAGNGTRLYIKL
jgi:hypothetical protein